MQHGARWRGGRGGRERNGGPRVWRLIASELWDRVTIVLRICPWGWHRPVDAARLEEVVPRAYRRNPFRALWEVEALGFRWADTSPRLAAGLAPPRLPAADLPRESLMMLHVGLGMALAKRDLADCRREIDTPAAVHRFLADAEASAVPGFLDAVAEPLGLVTRFEHPWRVAAVGRELARQAPALVPWFWHGVGRCLLFLPECFLPRPEAGWRAALRLAREIADPEHRSRARVGWACGLTLVHMRRPWLVADLLRRHGGEIEGAGDGFADALREGVVEAIDVRREATPGCEEMIRAYLAYRPPSRRVEERWRRLVEEPGLRALSAAEVEGTTALSCRRAAARRLGVGTRGLRDGQLVLDFQAWEPPPLRLPTPRRARRGSQLALAG
jgi:hypothetical protein